MSCTSALLLLVVKVEDGYLWRIDGEESEGEAGVCDDGEPDGGGIDRHLVGVEGGCEEPPQLVIGHETIPPRLRVFA